MFTNARNCSRNCAAFFLVVPARGCFVKITDDNVIIQLITSRHQAGASSRLERGAFYVLGVAVRPCACMAIAR